MEMEVYGLTGPSGTGKSYHSGEVCEKYGINTIIDDGLLIYEGNIVAGKSAKKEPTKIGAIKMAIFESDENRINVKNAIEKMQPQKILILGTSDRMVEIIVEKLGLPRPSVIVHIEEIASKSQMKKARKLRNVEGMHVIPASTIQVRKQFSGFFLDPKRGFRDENKEKNEKTIVRPTYSYTGNFIVGEDAIADIVRHLAKETEGIGSVLFVASENSENGMYVRAIVQCEQDVDIKRAAKALQKSIWNDVSYMTACNMIGVDVELREFKVKI